MQFYSIKQTKKQPLKIRKNEQEQNYLLGNNWNY